MLGGRLGSCSRRKKATTPERLMISTAALLHPSKVLRMRKIPLSTSSAPQADVLIWCQDAVGKCHRSSLWKRQKWEKKKKLNSISLFQTQKLRLSTQSCRRPGVVLFLVLLSCLRNFAPVHFANFRLSIFHGGDEVYVTCKKRKKKVAEEKRRKSKRKRRRGVKVQRISD